MKYRMLLAAVSASLAVLAAPAWAWPDREITLTVNYGAGGNTDVASREVARAMEAELGKPVVVFNRPGALGTIGPAYVTKQPADGYNVGVVTLSSIAIMPHLMDVPYDTDSFDFVAAYGRYRYGVVVRADSPYQTIDDLVAAAKAGPGIFFGAPSAPNNLAMFDLGRVSGGKFEQVAYKSGSETVAALLGGQVEVIVQNPSDVIPYLKSGRLRLLASASPLRWPEYPDVPTLKQEGYDVEIDSWLGLAVPKGTPEAVRQRLEAAAQAAVESERLQGIYKQMGVDPVWLSGADYLKLAEQTHGQMGKAIKAANLPRMSQ
ncbi:Bug family tripartite tricarboxylate transporter substrate binding protein [Bordetella trematum]|uniref:Bug family tripartite tricarboxylate transporter substrate binding protein n=1 Tax=Bordetella trematum TaxID=123899 RepID=UPI000D99DAF7|nr:tripartite tricarboxylate transporter substrate binding protein [Bordetella trematum]SPU49109.1 putattive exported protein [Bordetella trematum]VDH04168.1 Tripartite tricarboxylate transporter family receptor [Bordetella trematum]